MKTIRIGFYDGRPEIEVQACYYYNDYDKGVINLFTYDDEQRRKIVATFSLQHNYVITTPDHADA